MRTMKLIAMRLLYYMILSVPVAAAHGEEPNDGLVAYWPIADGNGESIKDHSNSGNDGIINGKVNWIDVKGHKMLEFDGTSTYIDCGNVKSLCPADSISVTAWVKPYNDKGGGIVCKYGGINGGYYLTSSYRREEGTNGKPYFFLRHRRGDECPQETVASVNAAKLSMHEWHFIACSGQYPGLMKLYVDGILCAEKKIDFTFANVTDRLVVGKFDTDLFSGIITQVRLYNRELSVDEVEDMYIKSQPPQQNVIKINKIDTSTPIDGRLADDAWKKATYIPSFSFQETNKTARKQSSAFIKYDENQIYFAFKFCDFNINKLKCEFNEHDAPIWNDDCLEIFLDVNNGKKDYFHFIANANGMKAEEQLTAGTFDRSWNPEWVVATSRGDDFWIAEVSIPFKSLGLSAAPEDGMAWGISLNREEKELGENSGWPNGYFHKPEKFGTLVFGSYTANINKRIHELNEQEKHIQISFSKLKDPAAFERIAAACAENNKRMQEISGKLSLEISENDWCQFDREVNAFACIANRVEIKTKIDSLLKGIKNKMDLKEELDDLSQKVEGTRFASTQAFQELEREYWENHSQAPYLIWHKNPWTNLLPFQYPRLWQKNATDLEVVMGVNEYKSASFVFTNLRNEPVKVRVRTEDNSFPIGIRFGCPIKPERTGEKFGNKDPVIKNVIGEVSETINDMLPLLDDLLIIPPFQSREVWFTLRSHKMLPGDYQSTVMVEPQDMAVAAVKLRIKVLPVILPVDPIELPLCTYVWDYIDSALSGKMQAEARQDLQHHYINVPCSRSIPYPTYDTNGQMNIDYGRFDQALSCWLSPDIPRPQHIVWYVCLDHRWKSFGDNFMDSQWKDRFASWLTQFTKHIKEKGIASQNVILQLMDETTSKDFEQSASYFKQLDANIMLLANPTEGSTCESIVRSTPFIDVWCPNLNLFMNQKKALSLMKTKAKHFWNYANPLELSYQRVSPYYYRLVSWRTWKIGMTGTGIWTYLMSAHQPSQYDLVYLRHNFGDAGWLSKAENIIPSKRWEAWREGVTDYFYLDALGKAIQKAKRAKVDPILIEHAEKALAEWPQIVIDKQTDFSVADEAKNDIIRWIVKIEGAACK